MAAPEPLADDGQPVNAEPAPENVATPILLNRIVTTPALVDALHTLDLEVVCDEQTLNPTDLDDLFGYRAEGPYVGIYAVTRDGTGGGNHLWRVDDATEPDKWPVVHLGSEGERAKVGRNLAEFLQVACSLAPHFPDVVGRLPGLNTLPDNGDIEGASAADFNRDRILEHVGMWLAMGHEEIQEAITAADLVLDSLNLQRLELAVAVDTLLAAHLQNPRFAIQSEE